MKAAAPLLKTDRGAAIVLLSLTMVLLIGLSAFAVDLGWLWLNASRVQSAADAAALSGVTHLPANALQADISAKLGAAANGYPDGGGTAVTTQVLLDNSLRARVSTQVETFFLRVLGTPTISISRDAVAQFVLPVPLGSNNHRFGWEADNNLLAAIQGQYTRYQDGDPYATECNEPVAGDNPDSGCVTSNPEYRPAGYHIGIQVDGGAGALDVRIFDAGHYNGSAYGDRLLPTVNAGPQTVYQLYLPDSTPYDFSDNVPIANCRLDLDAGESAGTYENAWRSLCSSGFIASTPGIYTLRVWTVGGGGINDYAVSANTTGTAARAYGLGDMSLEARLSGVTNIDLAEIEDVHAGKTLEVSLFDPGDGSDGTISVNAPGFAVSTCQYRRRGAGSWTSGCTISTSANQSSPNNYNGDWIDWQISIPDTYMCTSGVGPGCFWTLTYDYTGPPTDRTTWSAAVIGNPVRLVTETTP